MSVEAIKRALGLLDGIKTFYCALARTSDESRVACLGKPNRRIVQTCLCEDEYVHMVLLSARSPGKAKVRIEIGDQASAVIDVPNDELLTEEQTLAVFLEFFNTGGIPLNYTRRPKRYEGAG